MTGRFHGPDQGHDPRVEVEKSLDLVHDHEMYQGPDPDQWKRMTDPIHDLPQTELKKIRKLSELEIVPFETFALLPHLLSIFLQ